MAGVEVGNAPDVDQVDSEPEDLHDDPPNPSRRPPMVYSGSSKQVLAGLKSLI